METERYLSIFIDESREHLQALNDHLLILEKNPAHPEIISEVFRSAHTLKGMAASMGFEGIAALTHSMENVFEKIRGNQLTVTSEMIDVFFSAIELLEETIDNIAEGNEPQTEISPLVEKLDSIARKQDGAAEGSAEVSHSTPILDEYGERLVKKAAEMGYLPFSITVQIHKDCLLKGARAYMVIDALDHHGEIIQAIPSVEELEEGDFDGTFQVIFLSREEEEFIQHRLLRITEVEDVTIARIDPDTKTSPDENEEESEKTVENREQTEYRPVFSKNGSKTIRVQIERIDEMLNLFEELVIERGRLETLAEGLESRALDDNVQDIKRISSQMQTLLLSLRMVPVEQVFRRFPRMIRELSRDLHKKVELEIYGEDTELDRLVLDEISDPLVHMIRNSLDHGIELPGERRIAGKPDTGKLILRAFHSGNHVFIEIEDDGAGLNRKKIADKAIEKGMLTTDEAASLSDEEIFQFLLLPGFSTADKVSDVSGRGVGLDAAKNKIESLGGHLYISSREGEGTTFSIQLPLTLSIISSLLVKVREHTFAIPLSSIIRTYILKRDEVLQIGSSRAMDLMGQVIPLISICESLEIAAEESKDETAVVLVKSGDNLAGLIVDSFIGQREIVIKSLGRYLGDVFGFSGATILGDGRIALVLDPNAFISR